MLDNFVITVDWKGKDHHGMVDAYCWCKHNMVSIPQKTISKSSAWFDLRRRYNPINIGVNRLQAEGKHWVRSFSLFLSFIQRRRLTSTPRRAKVEKNLQGHDRLSISIPYLAIMLLHIIIPLYLSIALARWIPGSYCEKSSASLLRNNWAAFRLWHRASWSFCSIACRTNCKSPHPSFKDDIDLRHANTPNLCSEQ